MMFETEKFDILDDNRFCYNYNLGIPYYIESTREVVMNGKKDNAKSWEIVRIEILK